MNNRKDALNEARERPPLQLGWLLKPDVPPEQMIQFVMARRKRKRLVWRICEVNEDSRKYYTYLFVLSVRVHDYLRKHAESDRYRMKLDDSTNGPIVRYLYNMMGKSMDHYEAVDPFLREKMQAIFKRSTKKGKHLSLVDKYTASIFGFGHVSKCPADVTEGSYPKEIEYDKIAFEQMAIDDKCLCDLTDHICSSTFWTDLAKITKGRRRRKRTSPAHEDLWYLRRAEDVLEMYDVAMSPENARWFRKTGPIAVDFAEKTVYRRPGDLSQLKSLVAAKAISLFVGPPASGKTVLALNLAYELCKSEKTYYFDCDKVRNLDGSRLLSDLRTVKGTVIIENIHLAPQEFQSVYSAFKHDRYRHIIFTSRSTLGDSQYSRSEDLTEAETVYLEPIRAVDKLIEAYCAGHKIDPMSPETRDVIKETASEDLWLLAYVLTGYLKAGGQGDPKQWFRDGVLRDLQDMENTNAVFPEVLVAISALYRHEILMAEAYLINNLGFTVGVLNSLSQRGEIVRHQSSDGEVLYGLPHTALAHAYWECGNKYKRRRNLMDYESIIHEYVISGFSNGLRTLAAVEEAVQDRVKARLEKEDRLPEIISNEQSTRAVVAWLRTTHSSTIAREDMLTALAHKIEEHDCAAYVPELLKNLFFRGGDIWKAFCARLDCRKLANRIASTGRTVWIGITIFEMFRYDEPMMQKLYASAGLEKLLRELNETDDTWTIGRCVSAIYKVDPNADKKLKVGLNWQRLADRLCGWDLLWSIEQCLSEIMYANPNAARRLCGLMSPQKLAKVLDNCSEIMTSRGQVIATIYQANHAFGARLWRAYREKLGRHISEMKDPTNAVKSLRAIGLVSPKMASEILEFFDSQRLAETLSGPKDLTKKVEFACWILHFKKAGTEAFWEQYKHSLATTLSDPVAMCSIAQCLREISFGNKERPHELCGWLNVKNIAGNLNNSVHFWGVVDDILSTVLQSHNVKGRELATLINYEQAPQPAGRLFLDIWSGLSHVQDICSIDRDVAKELCAHIDIGLLADRLSQAGELFVKEVGEWVNTLHGLIPSRSQELWTSLDKKQIAAMLSVTEDVDKLASCLEQIDAAQEQEGWVKELCMQIDLAPLAFTLKHTQDDESRERLLAVISKNCPTIHEQLLCMVNEQ